MSLTVHKLEHPLNGLNWFTWKIMCEVSLDGRDLLCMVDGSTPEPTVSPNLVPLPGSTPTHATVAAAIASITSITLAEWKLKNSRARAQIVLNCDPDIALNLSGLNARDTWLKLCAEYEDTSTLTRALAGNALRELKYQDGTSMRDHIKQLRALAQACATSGNPISDIDFGMVIVMSLPSSWSSIIGTIVTNSNSVEVANRLITEDNRRTANGESKQAKVEAALSVGETKRNVLVCENCGKRWHSKDRCWAKGGGREGQGPKSKEKEAGNEKEKEVAATATEYHLAFAAITAEDESLSYDAAKTLSRNSSHDSWFIDSGPTSHMTNDFDNFTTYNSITPVEIQVAKSSVTFRAIGCGTIAKTMMLKDRRTVVTFHNVLYTPELSANLLSVSQLDDAGVNLKFGSGAVIWENEGVEFARGSCVGRLYRMDFEASVSVAAKRISSYR